MSTVTNNSVYTWGVTDGRSNVILPPGSSHQFPVPSTGITLTAPDGDMEKVSSTMQVIGGTPVAATVNAVVIGNKTGVSSGTGVLLAARGASGPASASDGGGFPIPLPFLPSTGGRCKTYGVMWLVGSLVFLALALALLSIAFLDKPGGRPAIVMQVSGWVVGLLSVFGVVVSSKAIAA